MTRSCLPGPKARKMPLMALSSLSYPCQPQCQPSGLRVTVLFIQGLEVTLDSEINKALTSPCDQARGDKHQIQTTTHPEQGFPAQGVSARVVRPQPDHFPLQVARTFRGGLLNCQRALVLKVSSYWAELCLVISFRPLNIACQKQKGRESVPVV